MDSVGLIMIGISASLVLGFLWFVFDLRKGGLIGAAGIGLCGYFISPVTAFVAAVLFITPFLVLAALLIHALESGAIARMVASPEPN